MAYDVTALQTAIAEGRVNEGEAVQLLNEFYNWELKVAKLLTVKTEPEAPQEAASEVVHDPTPEELAQPEQPVESTSTAETETPATEETPAAEQPAEQPTE